MTTQRRGNRATRSQRSPRFSTSCAPRVDYRADFERLSPPPRALDAPPDLASTSSTRPLPRRPSPPPPPTPATSADPLSQKPSLPTSPRSAGSTSRSTRQGGCVPPARSPGRRADRRLCGATQTAGYHVGEEPDERSVETCRKHGVPINSLCRQLEVRRLPSLRRGGCR